MLHFNSLHFDAPRIRCFIQGPLHGARDTLPVTEDLMEVLSPKDGPECGLGQELGAMMGILHIGHADSGVADPVVNHRVH